MAKVIGSGSEQRIDLAQCEQEPIHIPGSIQGHGVLVAVVEPELTIEHVSVNVREFFGKEPGAVVGRPLAEVIGRSAESAIATGLQRNPLASYNPLRLVVSEREFDGIVHRSGATTIVELEPTEAVTATDSNVLRPVLARLQAAGSVQELLAISVQEIHAITGFERVMAYRFHDDAHGEVIEEARAEDVESYLGLHYPASDIPSQARSLYVRNWLRIIPDVGYKPVPLFPALSPRTGEPLDLSQASLRSVSPVHLEYLRNMDVGASMSVSVIRGQTLRGLFACHHRRPHRIPFRIRAVCELIGRLVSVQAAALVELEATARRGAIQEAEIELVDAIRGHPGGWEPGLASRSSSLLRIVNATGAAVCGNQQIYRMGPTPSESQIRELAAWLGQRGANSFHTNALSQVYAPALEYSEHASGLLAITIEKPTPSHVLWFRCEVPKTVTWGGDPSKPVESSARGTRISPRRSFAAWLTTVRGFSTPWDRVEIDVAEDLRRHAVERDLAQNITRAEQAIRTRDEILAIVSHDLKSPLSVIQSVAHLISRDTGHVRTGLLVERLQRASSRMNILISDLLDLARLEAGTLSVHLSRCDGTELASDVAVLHALLAEERGITLIPKGTPDAWVMGDRERLHQVLSNLVSNAIKFTPRGGTVRIDVSPENDGVRFSVTDTGPGIDPVDQKRIFDRYSQAAHSRERSSAGLGLYIARGIVEAHHGRIWVESAPGKGSKFAFTIPRA